MAQRIERKLCPSCHRYEVDIHHVEARFSWDTKWLEWECPICGDCERLEQIEYDDDEYT